MIKGTVKTKYQLQIICKKKPVINYENEHEIHLSTVLYTSHNLDCKQIYRLMSRQSVNE